MLPQQYTLYSTTQSVITERCVLYCRTQTRSENRPFNSFLTSFPFYKNKKDGNAFVSKMTTLIVAHLFYSLLPTYIQKDLSKIKEEKEFVHSWI